MNRHQYRGKIRTLAILDILAMCLSFSCAIGIRYILLLSRLGSKLILTSYALYFIYAVAIYVLAFLFVSEPRIEQQSYREIVVRTVERHIIFFAAYIMFFFIFRQELTLSRVVVALFFMGNVVLCSLFRILYQFFFIGTV